jgi:ADP-heptose:LPS heptosyltransferase/archaellum component FlaC
MTRARPNRLLIIRTDAYGDIVLFEPVLRILREKWPKTEIAVLIQERYADLAPLLTPRMRWLTTKCDPYHTGPAADLESLRVLRRQIADFAPDCVVAACFDKTWLEAAIAAFTPSARQVSLGAYQLDAISHILLSMAIPVSGAEIYRESVPVELDSFEWDKNLRLAGHLTGREVGRLRPQLTVPEAAGREAAAFFRDTALEPAGFAACCPAGTAKVSIKAWPVEKFGEIVAWLWEQHGLPTLLLGHDSEKDILNAVQRAAKDRGANPAVWTGKSGQIATLAALLHQSQFYFGNDTGPLHMAGALNRPVVTIFGGGHWPRFRSAARRSVCVVQPLPCFGCRWECHFGDAPCVKTIPTDTVKTAIGRLLSSADDGSEDVLVEASMTPSELELIAKTAVTLKRSRYTRVGGVGGPTELLPRAALERLVEQLQFSEADRAARLEVIQQQGRHVLELENEAHRWLEETRKYSAQAQQLETARAEVLKQLESSEAARTELSQQLSRLTEENRHHQSQLTEAGAQINGLRTELERRRVENESLTRELQASRDENRNLASRLDAQPRALDGAVKSLDAARTRIRDLQERFSEIDAHPMVRVLKAWRLWRW